MNSFDPALPGAEPPTQPNDLNPSEPSLGSFQQSSLGSLSQSVRSKNLKRARISLIVAFVILLLQAGLEFATMEHQADQVIQKETKQLRPGMVVDPEKVKEIKAAIIRIGNLYALGVLGMAIIFLFLAIFVNRFPLFCTVGGLILYLGYSLIRAYLITLGNEQGGILLAIFEGWLWKLIIIIGLVKGIQSAVTYHREEQELQGLQA
jgi:hypothetical protein